MMLWRVTPFKYHEGYGVCLMMCMLCRYAVLAYLGYNQDLQRGVLLLLQQVQRAAPGIST